MMTFCIDLFESYLSTVGLLQGLLKFFNDRHLGMMYYECQKEQGDTASPLISQSCSGLIEDADNARNAPPHLKSFLAGKKSLLKTIYTVYVP
jgi:hypothetical protein